MGLFKLHYQTLVWLTPLVMAVATTSLQQNNFFSWNSGVHNGAGWGFICYDLSLYVPTCGWQLILTSSYSLTRIEVWHSDAVQQDDYTFITTNKFFNGDLSGSVPPCDSITLVGSFGNTRPDIVVNFYCVCTPTSSGNCQGVPYETVSGYALSATTTGPSLSLTSSMVTFQTPETTWYQGQSQANPSQIYLRKVTNTCYLGPQVTVLTSISRLPFCCSLCITDASCAGVNFREVTKQCDLVKEDLEVHSSNFGFQSNCQFWDVVWKR